jgi:hypothetical protein
MQAHAGSKQSRSAKNDNKIVTRRLNMYLMTSLQGGAWRLGPGPATGGSSRVHIHFRPWLIPYCGRGDGLRALLIGWANRGEWGMAAKKMYSLVLLRLA